MIPCGRLTPISLPAPMSSAGVFVMNKTLTRALVGASALVVVASANAAAMTLPAELTDALGSVAVIGAGVFAIAVGIKLYKWARGAL